MRRKVRSSGRSRARNARAWGPAAVAVAAAILVLAGVLVARSKMVRGSASEQGEPAAAQAATPALPVAWEVVATYPHDPEAFLQGLLYDRGFFYESTGLLGQSTLRKVDVQTGKVLRSVSLPDDLFGEGLARVDQRLIQLTWTTNRGIVYDLSTFKRIREFTYDNEGWGLTYDGRNLIMSDGTSSLTYLDPTTFAPTGSLPVILDGQLLAGLNELEYIHGEIWANVWRTDTIVRIDPTSGRVTSYLDLTGLRPPSARAEPEDVLNGIAYDPGTKRIFVGGKRWPEIFEIRLK